MSQKVQKGTVCMFKVETTVATLPRHGKKKINGCHQNCLQDLQQDLMAADSGGYLVCTVRIKLIAEQPHAWTPSCPPQLTQKKLKKSALDCWKLQKWATEVWEFGFGAMKLNLRPVVQQYVGGRRIHWKEHPACSEAQVWLSDTLELVSFIWHWKPAVCGGKIDWNIRKFKEKLWWYFFVCGSWSLGVLDFPERQQSQM